MQTTAMHSEKCRTSGDGMEQGELLAKTVQENKRTKTCLNGKNVPVGNQKLRSVVKTEYKDTCQHLEKNSSVPLPGLHALYRRQDCITRSLAPVLPKGELIKLTPRLVTPLNSVPEYKKDKPPKFVPYEPYPGAVSPIVMTNQKPHNKNNLDINILVSQMSTMRTQELDDNNKDKCNTDICNEGFNQSNTELENLKMELLQMREEKEYYQGQYKFQTQVNSELKNLLVASVGEDLLTRVNVLTEDKLQLAKALLDTANNLSTHTEQIEFLAGQCEVWRSKFLASSVMVEELARWKADLTQKNRMLHESTKRLLHDMHQLRQMQLELLKNLKFLAKIRYLNLPGADVMTLSAENLNILQQLVLHCGVGMPEDLNFNISAASSNPLSETEKYAVEALEFISQPLISTDEAIKALFSQTQKSHVIRSNCAKDEPPLEAHIQ